MRLFESDNIWKRKAREQYRASHPLTPHEKWKQELRSQYLWLTGGILVAALTGAAIAAGAAELDLTTGVILLMVTAYSGLTAKQIGDLRKNEPALTPEEKKRAKKR